MGEWMRAGCRGIAKVVTGGGKTVFAGLCITQFWSQRPDGRIIVLVPTTSLLDQWFVALQEDLALTDHDIATYSGEGKPAEPRRVNLMVLNTARTWVSRVALGAEVLLIADECHRAGSPHNACALGGNPVATLGLSATPEREGDDSFEAVLVPALGRVFYEYGYNEAAADGVISDFDLVNVRVELSSAEDEQYDRLTTSIAKQMNADSGVDDLKVRQLLLSRARVVACARMRIPVAVKLVERFPGVRTLVFHERVSAAREIHDLLVARGHSVALYHSGLETAVRRDNLRQYRRGVFDVLVTCRALDEGIDVPETAVAVIASATGSSRQRIQRLGRALRPASKKSHATVLTIYATAQEEERLRQEESRLTEARAVAWETARSVE